MAPPIPKILPAPEWSGSPMVEGGPSLGAVQVNDGSYPGKGGKSSGEVMDTSMDNIAELRGGGFILY